MATATVSNRFLAALGPVKMEIVQLAATTDAGDTFTTTMQRPLFAAASLNTTHAEPIFATVNSATKTVTVSDNGDNFSNLALTVLVFGF